MGKQRGRITPPPPRPRRWRWAILGALALIVLGGAFWWVWEPPQAAGGTPRLVLDREVLDFGYVAFDTPVRAVFAIRNAGDGSLKLTEAPRVKVVSGC